MRTVSEAPRPRRRIEAELGQVHPQQGSETHGAAAGDAQVDLHDAPDAQHGFLVCGVGCVLEDHDVGEPGNGADDDASQRLPT